MGKHLQYHAFCCNRFPGEQARTDETHMGKGGIGQHFTDVVLHHGDHSTINHSESGKSNKNIAVLFYSHRKKAKHDGQHAVNSHFQENSRHQHGAFHRRFGISIRLPGVKRKERHLNGKSHEEGQKQPALNFRRKVTGRETAEKEISGAILAVHVQNGQQHAKTSSKRVEKKLQQGSFRSRTSVARGNEVDRKNGCLIAKIKQHQILCHEYAIQANLKQENQCHHIAPNFLFVLSGVIQLCRKNHQCGEHQKPVIQSVYSEGNADAE